MECEVRYFLFYSKMPVSIRIDFLIFPIPNLKSTALKFYRPLPAPHGALWVSASNKMPKTFKGCHFDSCPMVLTLRVL